MRQSFLHYVLDMNQFAIIACIGSLILTLTRPVASYNQWAFDVGQPLSSCSNSDVNFLKPKMWRVVTIANVTGNWVSQNQGSSLLSNKPAIARKLLGSSDAKYAQMPFLGGWIMGAGEQANAWGIANLVGPTDILSANPLTASHNVVRTPRAYEGPSTGFASYITQIADSSHSLYTAIVETWGTRAGNFTQQETYY